MNEEQRKWRDQYIHSLGSREILRLAFAIVMWVFVGIALSILAGSSYLFDVFFVALFVFPFIAPKWKPAYNVFRRIVANDNLPAEPYPRSTSTSSLRERPWWSFLPSIWWLLIDLLLLLVVLGYLSKR